ncbi:MAG: ATP-binding protein [Candidatus Thermoplasmatota archaeon]|nr:ATP-binding protein [Candidatus Thermoplasmatota archaeon]MBU1941556.1 ATP-binding protein [Candidatus Thermoplasmatota archaeon]
MSGVIEQIIREYWEKPLPELKQRDIVLSLEKHYINDIVGPRRSGKTYLMFLTIKKLLKTIPLHATIYINFENRKLLPLKETYFNDIITFIHAENLLNNHPTIYLFLDEVQRIEKWEHYIRSIYDEFKNQIKIIVSGSSANLLSTEYAQLLTGRHLTTQVTPLSFKEFLTFKNITIPSKKPTEKEAATIEKLFNEYLTYGGFPDVVLSTQKDDIISQLFTDIVTRDVQARIDIRKKDLIEEFSNYLASNVSNLLSFNKMNNYFNSRGIKTSVPTISTYFWHLKNAFLFFDTKIYSHTIKDQMQYPRKIYCIDNGIVNIVGFKTSQNMGSLYENTVANELHRCGHKIYYWKNKHHEEVDFVIIHGTQVTHVLQVCYTLTNNSTKYREVKALIKAMEAFNLTTGLILTEKYTDTEIIDNKTIIYQPLWTWLLKRKKTYLDF